MFGGNAEYEEASAESGDEHILDVIARIKKKLRELHARRVDVPDSVVRMYIGMIERLQKKLDAGTGEFDKDLYNANIIEKKAVTAIAAIEKQFIDHVEIYDERAAPQKRHRAAAPVADWRQERPPPEVKPTAPPPPNPRVAQLATFDAALTKAGATIAAAMSVLVAYNDMKDGKNSAAYNASVQEMELKHDFTGVNAAKVAYDKWVADVRADDAAVAMAATAVTGAPLDAKRVDEIKDVQIFLRGIEYILNEIDKDIGRGGKIKNYVDFLNKVETSLAKNSGEIKKIVPEINKFIATLGDGTKSGADKQSAANDAMKLLDAKNDYVKNPAAADAGLPKKHAKQRTDIGLITGPTQIKYDDVKLLAGNVVQEFKNVKKMFDDAELKARVDPVPITDTVRLIYNEIVAENGELKDLGTELKIIEDAADNDGQELKDERIRNAAATFTTSNAKKKIIERKITAVGEIEKKLNAKPATWTAAKHADRLNDVGARIVAAYPIYTNTVAIDYAKTGGTGHTDVGKRDANRTGLSARAAAVKGKLNLFLLAGRKEAIDEIKKHIKTINATNTTFVADLAATSSGKTHSLDAYVTDRKTRLLANPMDFKTIEGLHYILNKHRGTFDAEKRAIEEFKKYPAFDAKISPLTAAEVAMIKAATDIVDPVGKKFEEVEKAIAEGKEEKKKADEVDKISGEIAEIKKILAAHSANAGKVVGDIKAATNPHGKRIAHVAAVKLLGEINADAKLAPAAGISGKMDTAVAALIPTRQPLYDPEKKAARDIKTDMDAEINKINTAIATIVTPDAKRDVCVKKMDDAVGEIKLEKDAFDAILLKIEALRDAKIATDAEKNTAITDIDVCLADLLALKTKWATGNYLTITVRPKWTMANLGKEDLIPVYSDEKKMISFTRAIDTLNNLVANLRVAEHLAVAVKIKYTYLLRPPSTDTRKAHEAYNNDRIAALGAIVCATKCSGDIAERMAKIQIAANNVIYSNVGDRAALQAAIDENDRYLGAELKKCKDDIAAARVEVGKSKARTVAASIAPGGEALPAGAEEAVMDHEIAVIDEEIKRVAKLTEFIDDEKTRANYVKIPAPAVGTTAAIVNTVYNFVARAFEAKAADPGMPTIPDDRKAAIDEMLKHAAEIERLRTEHLAALGKSNAEAFDAARKAWFGPAMEVKLIDALKKQLGEYETKFAEEERKIAELQKLPHFASAALDAADEKKIKDATDAGAAEMKAELKKIEEAEKQFGEDKTIITEIKKIIDRVAEIDKNWPDTLDVGGDFKTKYDGSTNTYAKRILLADTRTLQGKMKNAAAVGTEMKAEIAKLKHVAAEYEEEQKKADAAAQRMADNVTAIDTAIAAKTLDAKKLGEIGKAMNDAVDDIKNEELILATIRTAIGEQLKTSNEKIGELNAAAADAKVANAAKSEIKKAIDAIDIQLGATAAAKTRWADVAIMKPISDRWAAAKLLTDAAVPVYADLKTMISFTEAADTLNNLIDNLRNAEHLAHAVKIKCTYALNPPVSRTLQLHLTYTGERIAALSEIACAMDSAGRIAEAIAEIQHAANDVIYSVVADKNKLDAEIAKLRDGEIAELKKCEGKIVAAQEKMLTAFKSVADTAAGDGFTLPIGMDIKDLANEIGVIDGETKRTVSLLTFAGKEVRRASAVELPNTGTNTVYDLIKSTVKSAASWSLFPAIPTTRDDLIAEIDEHIAEIKKQAAQFLDGLRTTDWAAEIADAKAALFVVAMDATKINAIFDRIGIYHGEFEIHEKKIEEIMNNAEFQPPNAPLDGAKITTIGEAKKIGTAAMDAKKIEINAIISSGEDEKKQIGAINGIVEEIKGLRIRLNEYKGVADRDIAALDTTQNSHIQRLAAIALVFRHAEPDNDAALKTIPGEHQKIVDAIGKLAHITDKTPYGGAIAETIAIKDELAAKLKEIDAAYNGFITTDVKKKDAESKMDDVCDAINIESAGIRTIVNAVYAILDNFDEKKGELSSAAGDVAKEADTKREIDDMINDIDDQMTAITDLEQRFSDDTKGTTLIADLKQQWLDANALKDDIVPVYDDGNNIVRFTQAIDTLNNLGADLLVAKYLAYDAKMKYKYLINTPADAHIQPFVATHIEALGKSLCAMSLSNGVAKIVAEIQIAANAVTYDSSGAAPDLTEVEKEAKNMRTKIGEIDTCIGNIEVEYKKLAEIRAATLAAGVDITTMNVMTEVIGEEIKRARKLKIFAAAEATRAEAFTGARTTYLGNLFSFASGAAWILAPLSILIPSSPKPGTPAPGSPATSPPTSPTLKGLGTPTSPPRGPTGRTFTFMPRGSPAASPRGTPKTPAARNVQGEIKEEIKKIDEINGDLKKAITPDTIDKRIEEAKKEMRGVGMPRTLIDAIYAVVEKHHARFAEVEIKIDDIMKAPEYVAAAAADTKLGPRIIDAKKSGTEAMDAEIKKINETIEECKKEHEDEQKRVEAVNEIVKEVKTSREKLDKYKDMAAARVKEIKDAKDVHKTRLAIAAAQKLIDSPPADTDIAGIRGAQKNIDEAIGKLIIVDKTPYDDTQRDAAKFEGELDATDQSITDAIAAVKTDEATITAEMKDITDDIGALTVEYKNIEKRVNKYREQLTEIDTTDAATTKSREAAVRGYVDGNVSVFKDTLAHPDHIPNLDKKWTTANGTKDAAIPVYRKLDAVQKFTQAKNTLNNITANLRVQHHMAHAILTAYEQHHNAATTTTETEKKYNTARIAALHHSICAILEADKIAAAAAKIQIEANDVTYGFVTSLDRLNAARQEMETLVIEATTCRDNIAAGDAKLSGLAADMITSGVADAANKTKNEASVIANELGRANGLITLAEGEITRARAITIPSDTAPATMLDFVSDVLKSFVETAAWPWIAPETKKPEPETKKPEPETKTPERSRAASVASDASETADRIYFTLALDNDLARAETKAKRNYEMASDEYKDSTDADKSAKRKERNAKQDEYDTASKKHSDAMFYICIGNIAEYLTIMLHGQPKGARIVKQVSNLAEELEKKTEETLNVEDEREKQYDEKIDAFDKKIEELSKKFDAATEGDRPTHLRPLSEAIRKKREFEDASKTTREKLADARQYLEDATTEEEKKAQEELKLAKQAHLEYENKHPSANISRIDKLIIDAVYDILKTLLSDPGEKVLLDSCLEKIKDLNAQSETKFIRKHNLPYTRLRYDPVSNKFDEKMVALLPPLAQDVFFVDDDIYLCGIDGAGADFHITIDGEKLKVSANEKKLTFTKESGGTVKINSNKSVDVIFEKEVEKDGAEWEISARYEALKYCHLIIGTGPEIKDKPETKYLLQITSDIELIAAADLDPEPHDFSITPIYTTFREYMAKEGRMSANHAGFNNALKDIVPAFAYGAITRKLYAVDGKKRIPVLYNGMQIWTGDEGDNVYVGNTDYNITRLYNPDDELIHVYESNGFAAATIPDEYDEKMSIWIRFQSPDRTVEIKKTDPITQTFYGSGIIATARKVGGVVAQLWCVQLLWAVVIILAIMAIVIIATSTAAIARMKNMTTRQKLIANDKYEKMTSASTMPTYDPSEDAFGEWS